MGIRKKKKKIKGKTINKADEEIEEAEDERKAGSSSAFTQAARHPLESTQQGEGVACA